MRQWTQSARAVHFLWFPVPASTSIPFIVMVLHLRWWTFFLALAVAIFQVYLRKKGRTLIWLVRMAKAKMSGFEVKARPVWYRRRMLRREGFDGLDLSEIRKQDFL